jgi:hypothetical protein
MGTWLPETCRELKYTYMKKELCVKLVIYKGYFTYHQVFNIKKFSFLPTVCFHMLFIYLSWNSDYIPV